MRRNVLHCGVCLPCLYRRVSLSDVDGLRDEQVGIDVFSPVEIMMNRTDIKRNRDFKSLLYFLKTRCNREVIETELIANGITGKDEVNTYTDFVLHSRKAERELFDLLCEYEMENVVFHWYSGPTELIPEIISKGYYFSVNEAMTVSKNGCSIIEKIPRNRILTETDAPYNNKCNIVSLLKRVGLTEMEIKQNFNELLNRII